MLHWHALWRDDAAAIDGFACSGYKRGITNNIYQLNTNQMESLDAIFNRYDTDKKSTFHNYTRQYEALLQGYRSREIKYLEIGVSTVKA